MNIYPPPPTSFHKYQKLEIPLNKTHIASFVGALLAIPCFAQTFGNIVVTPPTIDWGNSFPERPVDLESPTPTGFKNETPVSAWDERITLSQSRNWNQDVILNYANPGLWEDSEPIGFFGVNGEILFDQHTLRIFSPDMTDGSVIKADEGAKLSLSGYALEVYSDDAQSTIRASGGASISLDVHNVWLESVVGVNPSGLLRAQNGSLSLNSDNFVAFFKGKVVALDAPSNVGSIAAVMDDGRLEATGGRYFFAMDESVENASNGTGVYANGSATVALGKEKNKLDLLSITGVGYGLASKSCAQFDVRTENLYIETVSEIIGNHGTAVYVVGDQGDSNFSILADNAVLKGNVVVDGDPDYQTSFRFESANAAIDGDLSVAMAQAEVIANNLTVDGNINLQWGTRATINVDAAIVNGDILNQDYEECSLDFAYKQALVNGRIVAGRDGKFDLTNRELDGSEALLQVVKTTAFDGEVDRYTSDLDAVLAGDFANAPYLEGSAEINIETSAEIYSHPIDKQKYISTRESNSPVVSALRANADSAINLNHFSSRYSIFGNITAGFGATQDKAEQMNDSIGGQVNVGSEGAVVEVYGDVFALNGGTINLNLHNGSVLEGQVDAYLDQEFAHQTNRNAKFVDCDGNLIPEFDSGSTNLSIGAGSLWVARGKSLVSNLTLFEGSKIDLTKDAGSSILATEISGSTELTMRLSQTAEQSSMLYLGKVTEGTKITLDIVTDGIETIDDLEGVRFATIKNADSSGLSDVQMRDKGFFNVLFDIYSDEYEAADEENERWNGTADGTALKLGSDFVDDFVGEDKAQNWYIGTEHTLDVSDAGQAVIATARGLYYNAVEIDRFNQRYGDRRYDETNNSLWMRVRQDRWGTAAGVGDFKSQNTTYQIGYDYTSFIDSGKVIYGAAIDLMDGNTDYESISGSGQTKRYAVSAYVTYMSDNGSYLDMIGKVGRLSNEYAVKLDSGAGVSADYMNWMTALSIEAGHQLTSEASQWFAEPQIQAQYVFVSSNDYSNGQTKIDQDSIHSLITRAGFRVGRWLDEETNANVYIKADVLHEWAGDQDIHVKDKTTAAGGETFEINNHGTWFDVGFGFQAPLGKSFYAYGDAEYRFGNDLDQTWTFNFGGKYLF